jgi:hypothetical protein
MSNSKDLDAKLQVQVNPPPKALLPNQTIVPNTHQFRCLNIVVAESLHRRLRNPPVDLSKIEF